jgi:hypothetical protein
MNRLAQSVQCLATDWTAGVRSPTEAEVFFPLTSASRPALGPTQPPVQWVPGALSPGVKRGRGVMLTTHPLLVPRSGKSRSSTSCHQNAPIWSVTGPLCLFLYQVHYLFRGRSDLRNVVFARFCKYTCQERPSKSTFNLRQDIQGPRRNYKAVHAGYEIQEHAAGGGRRGNTRGAI